MGLMSKMQDCDDCYCSHRYRYAVVCNSPGCKPILENGVIDCRFTTDRVSSIISNRYWSEQYFNKYL